MWMSNTATAAMMLPIMDSILDEIERMSGGDEPSEMGSSRRLRAMLSMGIAMAGNVGGTATLIGTIPNVLLYESLQQFGPDQPITFLSWMVLALPQAILVLIFVWLYLQFYFLGCGRKKTDESEEEKKAAAVKEIIRRSYADLGPYSYAGRRLDFI